MFVIVVKMDSMLLFSAAGDFPLLTNPCPGVHDMKIL